MALYQNDLIRIEVETSEIPWLKIFTQQPYKELSEAPAEVKEEIWRVLDLIEKEMLSFYKPDKINIASFGNYVPHLHFHIMARFQNDSFFPEPMWGAKQREGSWVLEDFDTFCEGLLTKL
ncbi:MAG TPA: HIT family protein [Campylobacteraceae bacterium]|jgi:diadenosine tetraphosphate (Ap4A) HIT family hydrolase|nr:HIT family protein [Campylobacteraceae bacterium]